MTGFKFFIKTTQIHDVAFSRNFSRFLLQYLKDQIYQFVFPSYSLFSKLYIYLGISEPVKMTGSTSAERMEILDNVN